MARAVGTTILTVWLATASYAGIWVEDGEAGRLLPSAQATAGAGGLDLIFGNLSGLFDVDLYLIAINDPVNFSAATVNAPGLYVPDPQLFLFTFAGLAVYMNDDDESGLNAAQSLLPAGHPFGPLTAGLYYLGIGWWDNEPFSAGGRMFADNGTATAGPGVGGAQPLESWDDNVSGRIDLETFYEINLTGADFAVPEPSSLVLVGAALLGIALKRRRG